MSRFIDADEFEKYFDREGWRTPNERWWPEREIGMVLDDLLSKSDVVEVVRCKECENWDAHVLSTFRPDAHYCNVLGNVFYGDFFCACGVRRKKI